MAQPTTLLLIRIFVSWISPLLPLFHDIRLMFHLIFHISSFISYFISYLIFHLSSHISSLISCFISHLIFHLALSFSDPNAAISSPPHFLKMIFLFALSQPLGLFNFCSFCSILCYQGIIVGASTSNSLFYQSNHLFAFFAGSSQ